MREIGIGMAIVAGFCFICFAWGTGPVALIALIHALINGATVLGAIWIGFKWFAFGVIMILVTGCLTAVGKALSES